MKLHHVATEKLEAHVVARITPEMVEWVRRAVGPYDPMATTHSAQFGYTVGWNEARKDFIKEFERLLTTSTNPEDL